MPITTNFPAVDDEQNEYPNLLITLAISGQVVNDTVRAAVALKGIPYREDDGQVIQHNSKRTFVTPDVFTTAQTDPAVAEAVQAVWVAIQNLVHAKNL